MTDNLCIRLVSLIVWHNIQRKAGLGHAVIDDFLLNVAFTRSQESGAARAAVEALINSRAVIQGNRFICSSFSLCVG